MTLPFVETLWQLILGHSVADFALQSKHAARMKNRNTDEGRNIWFQALMAHSLVNGAAVYIITGSMGLGIAETLLHFWIDYGKCDNWYGMTVDQALHIGCKLSWALMA